MPNDTTAAAYAQPSVSIAERAYRAQISTHCPNQDDVAMDARVGLAALRDQAAAGLAQCSDEAYPLLQAISSQAAIAVFAPWKTRRLFLTRCALNHTLQAARAIERAQQDG